MLTAGLVLSALAGIAAAAGEPMSPPSALPSIAARTQGWEKLDGFLPLWWDAAHGRLYLEAKPDPTAFLWQVSLASGVGSNAIGLDRGQLGPTHLVHFERVGPKILLVERNLRFRALSSDTAEQRAVEESFATSVLWGFTAEAEAADGRTLVDATAFFLSDQHEVSARLRGAGQGSYSIDESRSVLVRQQTRAFPRNTEVEAMLTYVTSDKPGTLLASVVPTPGALTVRVHHSFLPLPPPGFATRALDPRVGTFFVEVYDYAAAYTEPLEQRWVVRHRLRKKNPELAASSVVEPIVYWLDPGVPEPIRSAILDGASWWSKAFERAGFLDAFHVRELPLDVDPMDARFNHIHWAHRSSRGWSYGGSVVDPRTGEIVLGNVVLGSLRIRQDWLIASGLVASDPAQDADARELPLARLRQLAAHEVGHALGFEHNFATSTYGRASVMDYPAPKVDIVDGRLKLDDAYARGTGAYDDWALRYAYAETPNGVDEGRHLAQIVAEGLAAGLHFVKDDDARPPGSAHPLGSLWDNGSDAIEQLRHVLEVRRIALAGFGLESLPVGAPLSMLEARLLPLYLHHRYAVEAAAKLLAGVDFRYAIKGVDGRPSPEPVRAIVGPERQREALRVLLSAMTPEVLVLPRPLLGLLAPRAFGFEGGTAEYFSSRTTPVFDALAATAAGAELVLAVLLEPRRLARLVAFHAEDPRHPDVRELVSALISASYPASEPADSWVAANSRRVQRVVADRLMSAAADPQQAPEAVAAVNEGLRRIASAPTASAPALASGSDDNRAFRRSLRDDIQRFLARPAEAWKPADRPVVPPGAPIGSPATP